MIITKIIASFSRSINTVTYNGKESWVKAETTYEAQLESADDPKIVSQHLRGLAESDVNEKIKEIVGKLKGTQATISNAQ